MNPNRLRLGPCELATENQRYAGTAGCSAGNRTLGFRPAFLDEDTDQVYPSSYADGRPAPVHVLDGLPPALVVARSADGRACAVKDSVVSGFLRNERFYTRDEALGMIALLG